MRKVLVFFVALCYIATMDATTAISIAISNGYNIGRRGKLGYYLSGVKNGAAFTQQMPAEMNLSDLVKWILANPNK